MSDYVGPLEQVASLAEAARLVEAAWMLVGDAFAQQQVQEYGVALREGRRPRQRLHPWVPGLHWHRTHLDTAHAGPLPVAVLLVMQDMLALERVPDVRRPEYRGRLMQRIKQEQERALWEIRVAAQYAPAGIRAEWSGVVDSTPGAPDVRIPSFNAEIEVKSVQPHADIVTDYEAIFGALDDGQGQLAARAERRGAGPSAIVVVLPGAESLDPWSVPDSTFQQSMSLRLDLPDYAVVSAMVFVTEPEQELRPTGQQSYGARASFIVNNAATHPWPKNLPLVVNE